jgi:hypothetical protein
MPTDYTATRATTPAEYRQFAVECLQAVRTTTSPEVRSTLLKIAERSNDLADHAEQNAYLRGSSE